MDGDQLAVEYQQIRQQIKHALSEAVRDMGAVCQAMDRLDEVQRHFKAERRLHDSVSVSGERPNHHGPSPVVL